MFRAIRRPPEVGVLTRWSLLYRRCFHNTRAHADRGGEVARPPDRRAGARSRLSPPGRRQLDGTISINRTAMDRPGDLRIGPPRRTCGVTPRCKAGGGGRHRRRPGGRGRDRGAGSSRLPVRLLFQPAGTRRGSRNDRASARRTPPAGWLSLRFLPLSISVSSRSNRHHVSAHAAGARRALRRDAHLPRGGHRERQLFRRAPPDASRYPAPPGPSAVALLQTPGLAPRATRIPALPTLDVPPLRRDLCGPRADGPHPTLPRKRERAWMMRVVYVSHSKEVGGAELHLEGLMARVHATAGREATLVCRTDRALDEWVRRIEARAIGVRRLDLRTPADWTHLSRHLRGADLVHLMLAYPVGKYQFVAAQTSRLSGRPAIATHHLALDIDAIGLPGWKRRLWSTLFRRYGRLAQRHMPVSG